MIIELFGPPCAGKTTFCHLLAGQLRRHGYSVRLQLSQRPAETAEAQRVRLWGPLALVRRCARPLRELLAASGALEGRSNALRVSADLIGCIPQTSSFRTLRMRQYLFRLALSWRTAALSSEIVIFDQGFVQAAFSLACTAQLTSTTVLDRALDALPKPDLLVGVDAPFTLLEARYKERLRRQTILERWLEREARFTHADRTILAGLHRRLGARGQTMFLVDTSGTHSMAVALEPIKRAITVLLESNMNPGEGLSRTERGKVAVPQQPLRSAT